MNNLQLDLTDAVARIANCADRASTLVEMPLSADVYYYLFFAQSVYTTDIDLTGRS